MKKLIKELAYDELLILITQAYKISYEYGVRVAEEIVRRGN